MAAFAGTGQRTRALDRRSSPRPPCSSCTAKTRYRQRDEPCTVSVAGDGSVSVRFEAAQRAVTPGQSVVLYQDDECLGGAVILRTDARLERQHGNLAA